MAKTPLTHAGDKVSQVGRSRAFETADDLREASLEYLAWADANPLFETKTAMWQGSFVATEVPKPRAVTIVGLCLHLGISRFTWHNYRVSDEFDLVCEEIEDRMKQYKFENAVAGLMNPTLIARDIGLVDKQEIDLSNKDGTLTPKEQSAAVLEALKRKHAE